MTIDIASRRDFTLETYFQVAWEGKAARFTPDAIGRIRECRRSFMELLDSDPEIVIYGVTSGYGQHAHLRFNAEERKVHARRPPLAAQASFGCEVLPERVSRGIVFARLANYVEGHAAVGPELAEAVAAMLAEGPLPPVPVLGNGSPGEIMALSHLFAHLGERIPLAEKESLTLVNGSPCAAALVADAALAARRRLALAVEIFALSIEAMGAPLSAYDSALDELWGDPDEASALRALRALIDETREGRRSYQAPVSWRILPRVLGQAGRATRQAETAAGTSLASVTDNPVYIPPDAMHPQGRVLSNGGYHNAMAAPVLDTLAAAWADLALLCDRHVAKLLDGRITGLPDQLPSADGAYLGCLGFTAAGYAEQARQAAGRSLLPGSESGGYGQNDVSVPNVLAWRKEAEAGRALVAALACVAVVASQALHVARRPVLPELADLLEEIRTIFPPPERPVAPGPLAARLDERFSCRVFGEGTGSDSADSVSKVPRTA